MNADHVELRCELCGSAIRHREDLMLTTETHPAGPNHFIGPRCLNAVGDQLEFFDTEFIHDNEQLLSHLSRVLDTPITLGDGTVYEDGDRHDPEDRGPTEN